jgi:hypothetical protein
MALVVSPCGKAATGRKKTNDPAKMSMERVFRILAETRFPSPQNFRLLTIVNALD